MTKPSLGSFQSIPLADIRLSGTNPRKTFDTAALEDLANSIRAQGVIQPVLVRPRADFAKNQYELVTGERRFRASELAGMKEIPAYVRQLSDGDARDIQMVENLQRADLHPMEEAEGYQTLAAAMSPDGVLRTELLDVLVHDIARKVGKNVAYVTQRLKLLALIPEAQDLFAGQHLTLGHALLLARLTPANQDRAVRHLANIHDDKTPLANVLAEEREFQVQGDDEGEGIARMVRFSESEFKAWIAREIVTELKAAPWALEDAGLLPEAGACTTCPKRSGSNASLFGEITANQDACMDSACYSAKHKAYVQLTVTKAAETGERLLQLSTKHSGKLLKELTAEKGKQPTIRSGQWVAAKKGSCPDVRRGIFIDSGSLYSGNKEKAGDIAYVCANQKCKVHKHTVDSAARSGSSGGAQSYEEQQKAEKEKQAAYLASETPIRQAILDELLEEIIPGIEDIREMVVDAVRNADFICDRLNVPYKRNPNANVWTNRETAKSALEPVIMVSDVNRLARILVLDKIGEEIWPSAHWSDAVKRDREELWKICKTYGVDADGIAKRIAKETADKQKAVAIAAAAETKKPTAAKPGKAAAPPKKAAGPKKLNAAVRKRIADAMKKRWAQNQIKARPSAPDVDRKSAAAGERAEAVGA